MKLIMLICLIFILKIQLVNSLHYPQYCQAFKFSECIGPSTDFLETTPNMTLLPGLNGIKSISARGIWQFDMGPLQVFVTFSHSGKVCTMVPQSGGNRLNAVIQRVSGDLDDSVLSLYTERSFEGRQKTIAADIATFGENFVAKSWAFTGPKGFTLYEGENFTGNSTCLEPDPITKSKGWGAVAIFESNGISARSASVGCNLKSSTKIQGSSETSYAYDLKTGQKLEGIVKVVDNVLTF